MSSNLRTDDYIKQGIESSVMEEQGIRHRCFIQFLFLRRLAQPISITIVLGLLIFGMFNAHALYSVSAAPLTLATMAGSCSVDVFINEIHYDNAGADVGEFIEVAGPAGTDLSGWLLVFYNGNGGAVYNTTALSGVIDNEANGLGAVSFTVSGIQNGAPDGIALTDGTNLCQFLSYEGAFTAIGGIADGVLSTDIGASETGNTLVGQSLQLKGTGSSAGDFPWAAPSAESPGSINAGQTFSLITDTVSISKSAEPNTDVKQNGLVTYTVVITGNDAATTVVVTDTLPAETDFAYWIQQPAGATVINDEIKLTGSVSSTQPITISFVVTNTTKGHTVINTAELSGTTSIQNAQASYTAEVASIILINEVDSDTAGTDLLEFIELFDGGVGNTPLNGLVVVGYNGSDDQTTGLAVDLDGQTTDANGYFVIGNSAVANVGIIVSSNSIQNGPDAIALYKGNGADFPTDTPLTTVNLIDALVYDTNDDDDTGLLPLLNVGQPQVNEGEKGNQTGHSNQRCPNGAGGSRNTSGYGQFDPTPGMENVCGTPPPPAEVDFTRVYTIQGDGAASPLDGITISTTGVVVADFQDDGLNGFNIQDATGDNNPATSDGVFVFEGDATVTIPDLEIGDIVTLTAVVKEFFDLTELVAISAIEVGANSPLSALKVTLPLTPTQREQIEGMLIEVDEELSVTEVFGLGRYGQVLLSADGRSYQYTHQNAPNAAGYAAHQIDFANNTLKLDDKQSAQNPDPVIYPAGGLSGTNSLRGGDMVQKLTGVLHYSFGEYLLEPVGIVDFTSANPRPAPPAKQAGTLSVATINVLNFFTTLDDSGSICGPAANQDCRGAESASEFERQRDKMLAALLGLNADVIGIVEVENSADNAPLQSIIDGLNAVSTDTFAFIATGTIGTDAIRVGFIYKTNIIEPMGPFAVLDSSVDANFIDTKNRPALAQTFKEKATGEAFTAAINHFKSKGSNCNDLGDPNLNDGAGNCNLTRQKAAQAVAQWLATDPTQSGDPDFLILGDLNAYRNETPITTLENAGYVDLAERFIGDKAYSFVFGGEWGYLDYALANATLNSQVVGAAEWHINADEPISLDYNENFKSAGQITSLYNADAYRSSDHDPMVVSLKLGSKVVTHTLFLPIITQAGYADLVVDSVKVTGDSMVEIVIRNQGQAAVTSEFWVDLYIGLTDSNKRPTKVNDIWNNFSPYGATWNVTSAQLPLLVGQTLTLRVNDTLFDPSLSNIGGPIGANVPLYVHIDSANVHDQAGGVLENHEETGDVYNNIFGPVILDKRE